MITSCSRGSWRLADVHTIVNDYCSGFERRLMGGTSRLRIDKRSEVFLTGAVLFIFTGAS